MQARILPRLPELLQGTFDLLVIGGGINGTGIARDAARRGLRVALVEAEDLGYGTTGRSTRLIHGGLRYLAMYDFRLVHESLRERERLLNNAPHLVQPIRFLIPFYKGQRTAPWKLKIGLRLYDLLAGDTRVPPHETFTREQILAIEPGLSPVGLRGGAAYGDGQVALVERLCVENAIDAAEHGAIIVNHARCEEVLTANGRVTGARVRDMISGRTFEVSARRVVNTAGPWVDRISGVHNVSTRMTKGVHLVTPKATEHAILLFSPDDDRVFFSIPWLGHQLVGTTDTDYKDDPSKVAADAGDVEYLQRGIGFALPAADVKTVHYTYAGLRVLIPEIGKSESQLSREHQIVHHDGSGHAGLITLVGGKITPFRAVCEQVVDALEIAVGPSDTAEAQLPGWHGDIPALIARLETRLAALGMDTRAACTLANTYGARAEVILDLAAGDPALRDSVCPHAPTLRAEVRFVIDSEMAKTAADVLLRRTSCGWLACQGRDALPHVLDVLDATLGRGSAERKRDEAAYLAEVDGRRAWGP